MAEEAPIKASFVMTLEEVTTARAMLAERSIGVQVLFGVILVAAASPLVINTFSNGFQVSSIDWSAGLFIVIFCVLVAMYVLVRVRSKAAMRRAVSQDPVFNRRLVMEFSSDRVVSEVEGLSQTSFNWKSFVRVRRGPKGFVFYQGPQICVWVPEHAFASKADADAVAALAKERVSNYSES